MIQRKNQKTRLIDIAERVGCSKGAVASVLSNVGKNVIRVSEAKRTEILRVAEEMHYVPNLTARTLAGKSAMKIGVLIDSRAPRSIYQLLWTVEELAAERGYRLMVGQAHNDPKYLFDCYDNFLLREVDGVLCFAHEYKGYENEIRTYFQDKRNLVFYDPPEWDGAPYVGVNREAGVLQAMRHLQETGRQRIGLWVGADEYYYSIRQRLAGYRAGLAGPELITKTTSLDDYVEELQAKKLDAVIAPNDTHAACLARTLLQRGIRIPDDVALIGHDNEDFTAFYFPSISTIDQKPELVGKLMFELLMKQIAGEYPVQSHMIDTELVVRESSFKPKE